VDANTTCADGIRNGDETEIDCGGSCSACLVVPRGDRRLTIVLTAAEDESGSPYETVNPGAFKQARRAGINSVQMRYQWREIETAPHVYQDAELDEANRLFADQGVELILGLDPLDGPFRATPADLDTTPFDDRGIVSRYTEMLDHVLSRLKDLNISLVMVGNEVNIYLDQQNEWASFATFYQAVGDHIRAVSSARVATTATASLVDDPYRQPMQTLNQFSDVISLTEWASADFGDYFDTLTAEYAGRPISIQEIGYPSSPFVGSSEARQAQAVRDIFAAWDAHASQIENVSFFFLHDMSQRDAQGWGKAICAALPQDCNPEVDAALMSSWGLRTHPGSGADKEGFTALTGEASARGW
jgi:hypothetical protein